MKHITDTTDWYDYLPVSINDTYGDPFIDQQIDNTLEKIKLLRLHNAPIAVFTKAPFKLDVLQKIDNLGIGEINKKIIIFYSLTGLNEGGFSFENRVKMIQALDSRFYNLVIMPRPIIRRRNDSITILEGIVKVARDTKLRKLVLGGIHNNLKRKIIDDKVENYLMDRCVKNNVKPYYKTSCCAADISNQSCWLHKSYAPCNIHLLVNFGYKFSISDNSIILNKASTGDLNFVRMVTGSKVFTKRLLSNLNLLSIPFKNSLECTSSWFAWSENRSVCLGCEYCIIRQIEYLNDNEIKIGCHPKELRSIKFDNADIEFSRFRNNKISGIFNHEELISYDSVRTVKPCTVRKN